MEETLNITVMGHTGLRIDKYLSETHSKYSRSFYQNLIQQGLVYVNSIPVKSKYKVSLNDSIMITIPEAEDINVLPEDIPLSILYEDEDVLIINKPKGMVVHPAPGHYTGTLVNAVMFHCPEDLSGINGEIRPGIVHRIDRDTTGALIVCKNDEAHRFIAEQIAAHSVTRKYRGIVCGVIKQDDGTIDAPIGRHKNDRKKMAIMSDGRQAITHYHVLERFMQHTYVEFQLETGRTHQIRVHMASIHHPLLGDAVYGNPKNTKGLEGQTLHAMTIGFIHPRTKEYMEFSAPLPDYFESLLEKYRQ